MNELINRKWKNYFNWTITWPSLIFLAIIVGFFYLVSHMFSVAMNGGNMDSFSENAIFQSVLALGFGGVLLLFFSGIIFLLYTVWFFIASHNLFKMLGDNYIVADIVNLILFFLLGGLCFLVTPVYLWIKMNNYWARQGIVASWRAVV